MVHLLEDTAQLQFHMAHGEQNIPETAHISLFMLCVDIQVLVSQLGEQLADVIDNGAKSFHQ